MSAPRDMAALDRHLEALLDLDAEAREQRLRALHASDPELAVALQPLLGLADRGDTLELRAMGDGIGIVEEDAPAPDIPGYRILKEIGRGGMASVYAASRDVHGSTQQVAIKLLRSALLSDTDRDRFLNEQRILARLRHPGIATLLDAGLVQGRPYMVLEHIDGQPIDQCLRAERAHLPRILSAIGEVCAALSVAHQHFVIHRDIKPGNVLLDANGRVKLIDFGIAKTLEGASWASAHTATGSAPLTLRYASPEQLLGEPVGMGSDIYQLGLLLYQLLTGSWPFEENAASGPGERLRADALPIPASQRAADPAMRRALRGDLDAILLKCLQRNPADRYATVSALADDLTRYRNALPVRARQNTRGYRLHSFLRRHRLGASLATAGVVLLLVGAGAALLLAQRAQDYADRTERILDTVSDLFAHANPLGGSPEAVSIGEVVRTTSRRFLQEDDADPLFQALMLERLAELQRAIRDYAAEGQLLDRALELVRANRLGEPLHSRLRVQAAESAFARGDFDQVAPLIDASPPLAAGQHAAARYLRAKLLIERDQPALAEREFDWLLAELQRGDYPAIFHHTVHNSRGILLRRQGRFDEAIAAYRHSLAFLDPERLEHQEALLTVPTNIAIALGVAGRYAESEAEFTRHLRETEARLGADFPLLINVARNYATLLNRTRRYDSAYALMQRYRPAAEGASADFGQAHYYQGLAVAALNAGHDEQALNMAIRSIEQHAAAFSGELAALAGPLDQLAWLLFELGELPRAAHIAGLLLQHDAQRWRRAQTIIDVAAGRGLELPALPRGELPAGSCDAVEREALVARLVRSVAPDAQPIPDDCSERRAEILHRLGLPERGGQPAPAFAPEPLRSRFTRLGQPDSRPWPMELSAELARRLDAVVDGVVLPPRAAPVGD